ncbi:MAG: glycosyltransferase family 2 protein [Kiritimatiellae bacterium]|nr:glycosyltransferase family 2 protein [Kiritimatiellia bacterium]
MNDAVKISVCIITFNEEKNIRRCLESVKWADEIIVVDSFSTDSTEAICREYTDRFFKHRWMGYKTQKNIARSLAKNEWVFSIDSDEEVSQELYSEIYNLFKNGVDDSVSAFELPRMVWFLNKWIRHGDWYPDYLPRLYRKSCGRFVGQEIHERIGIDGKIQRLKTPLHHYTYDDITHQLNTLNKFTSCSADSLNEKNRSLCSAIVGMLFRAPFRFFRCYFIKRGFLDGMPGFIIATVSAFNVFVKYAKYWEMRKTTK